MTLQFLFILNSLYYQLSKGQEINTAFEELYVVTVP